MAYGSAIRRGLQLAGKIDKKYNLNKIFIDKYVPPGYRKTAYKIVDVTGALGGGLGLYRFAQSLYEDFSEPRSNAIPSQKYISKTYKSYKTRYRFSRRCRPRSSNSAYFNKYRR